MTVQREAQRVEGRTAILASEPSPTDLDLRMGDDVWAGEQFAVLWVEPAGSEPPVLPPGIKRLPQPGEAAVSPALARLASRHPALAARYPNRSVLDPHGVQSEGEMLAYVRMPEGRNLPGDLAGDLSEDTRAVRVRSFGPPFGSSSLFALPPFSEPPSVSGVVVGVLVFLVAPSLVFLAAGLVAAIGAHRIRSENTPSTEALGRTHVAGAVFKDGLIPALPSLVGVTVLWSILAPRLGWVPLTRHDVFSGDLDLPWWLLVTELIASVSVTGLFALIVIASATKSRVISRRSVLDLLWTVSLGTVLVPTVALATFVLAVIMLYWPVPMSSEAMLSVGVVFAATVGVLIFLPDVLRAVGADLYQRGSGLARTVGRALEQAPLHTARPFFGGVALIVVTLAASGLLSPANRAEAAPSPINGPQAVFIEWLDPHPDDTNRLAHALGTDLVVPFSTSGHAHEGGHHAHEGGHAFEDTLVIGAACHRLAPYFSGTVCNPNARYELPIATEQKLAEVMAPAAHGTATKVRLAPANDIAAGGSALVLDDAPLEDLEARVRDVAMREVPAPHIYSALNGLISATPVVAWITDGLVFALVGLTVGYLVWLFDNLRSAREQRCPGPGVPPRRFATLEAWLFAAPYCAAAAVAFATGLAIRALMAIVFPDTPMTWHGIGAALGVVTLVGVVGTASVALSGLRSMRQNVDRRGGHPIGPPDAPVR